MSGRRCGRFLAERGLLVWKETTRALRMGLNQLSRAKGYGPAKLWTSSKPEAGLSCSRNKARSMAFGDHRGKGSNVQKADATLLETTPQQHARTHARFTNIRKQIEAILLSEIIVISHIHPIANVNASIRWYSRAINYHKTSHRTSLSPLPIIPSPRPP